MCTYIYVYVYSSVGMSGTYVASTLLLYTIQPVCITHMCVCVCICVSGTFSFHTMQPVCMAYVCMMSCKCDTQTSHNTA